MGDNRSIMISSQTAVEAPAAAELFGAELAAELDRWQDKARALQAELAEAGIHMTWSIDLVWKAADA